MEKAMAGFRGGVGEGRHMTFVECLGVSQEGAIEGWLPVEGDLGQEPGFARCG